jgi:hypothetical protein
MGQRPRADLTHGSLLKNHQNLPPFVCKNTIDSRRDLCTYLLNPPLFDDTGWFNKTLYLENTAEKIRLFSTLFLRCFFNRIKTFLLCYLCNCAQSLFFHLCS